MDNVPEFYQGQVVNSNTEIEKSRAVQEVQAALVIAKKFPRDETQAYNRIIKASQRLSLASKALYAYPRGDQTVEGPSIRLLEVIAQNWGNLDFGIRELERREGVSIAESYCWDMETNVRQRKIFEVPHEIEKGKGVKKLTKQRDIYELIANYGARRLRSCMEAIIPFDIKEDAISQVKKTLAKGGGDTIEERRRRMVRAFDSVGVNQEMIEKRLKHSLDVTTSEELAELQIIYNTIKDKAAKRSEFFEFVTNDKVKMQEFNEQTMKEAKADNVEQLLGMIMRNIAEAKKAGISEEKILKELMLDSVDQLNGMSKESLEAVVDALGCW